MGRYGREYTYLSAPALQQHVVYALCARQRGLDNRSAFHVHGVGAQGAGKQAVEFLQCLVSLAECSIQRRSPRISISEDIARQAVPVLYGFFHKFLAAVLLCIQQVERIEHQQVRVVAVRAAERYILAYHHAVFVLRVVGQVFCNLFPAGYQLVIDR